MLNMLGLSDQAAAIYRATLAHPDHGVAALAVDTGLTDSQVRAALDELADLALLRPSLKSDGGLLPVSPRLGLTALLAAAEAEAAKRRAEIEATRAAVIKIIAEHDQTADRDGAVRLDGLDSVRIRLAELQLATESECLSLNPGGAHRPDARDAASPLNQNALERGVAIRAVCRDSFRNDTDTLAYARWLTSLGGQMRTVPIVPIPLIVIDRKIAIVPLVPADPSRGAHEVTSAGMVTALCALFEQIWSTGTPFGQSAPLDENDCTPTERALLDLVADGHTDESAARRLGVSLRTVRRMMSDLMRRLDASSRFQAGVNAATRGWLHRD